MGGAEPIADFQANLLRTLTRYAFPVAAATIGTLAMLILITLPHDRVTDSWPLKFTSGAAVAFLASFTMCLVADHQAGATASGRNLYSGLAFVGGFVLVTLLADPLQLSAPILFGGLALLLGVTEIVRPGSSETSFWNFNHNLWISAVVALIAAGLFSLGLMAILATTNFLLKTNLSESIYGRINVIAFCFVGPVSWLVQQSALGHAAADDADETTFLSRAVGAIVKFLLVPLLLVYALILHIYAGQIGITRVLPNGQLGWIVLTFGSLLIITALAAFKTRASGGAMVRGFWRVWPWLLAIPAVVLFLGILARTREYGITESRYLVLLAGVWLVLVMLTQGGAGALGWRRDIRLIPAIISGLLIIGSIGPWGAVGWSNRSQVNDLAARLTAAGLVEGGRLATSTTTKALTGTDRKRVAGIVNYLADRRRLGVLKPLFIGRADDPFAMTHANDWDRAKTIKSRFGIAADYPGHEPPPSLPFQFNGQVSTVINRGSVRIVSGVVMGQDNKSKVVVDDAAGTVHFSLEGGVVTVVDGATGKSAWFELGLEPAFKAAVEAGGSAVKPVVLKPARGDLDATMVLSTISGVRNPTLKINRVVFWLIIGGGT
jgi:hypothetical protein